MVFGSALSACPSCNTPSFPIGGRTVEPARKIQAVTVSDVHILAQAMINAAPDGHKKLIVFADSRQDAAFQAGWMQDHARRIRLRHMMHEVIAQAGDPQPLDAITDGLMEQFRKDQNLIDTLLPELTGEEAPAVFGHNKWVPVYKALRYMVLREFTTGVRRTDCLESMGLVAGHLRGRDARAARACVSGPRRWGSRPEEAVEAVSLLLDNWRRSRYFFVTSDPIFSRYHPKDDPYIQAGLLNLREFHPGGLDALGGPRTTAIATGLIARKGASAVQALVKKWASRPDTLDVDAAVRMLWEFLTDEAKLLRKVTLRSQQESHLAEVWQVDLERLVVGPSRVKERCTTCQRITTRKTPKSACTRYNCHGTTVTEQPDEENYDVWLMGRPFVMVTAEEHTAQVPGEIRNKIEQDFKSKHGRTNCLVATPTLEMGVNIGALDMALMRNVPPRPSNYWQRAGRAGREERMAVVVTYCRRSNHDRYFFDDPLRHSRRGDRGPDVQPPQPADGRQARPLGDPVRPPAAVPGAGRGRRAGPGRPGRPVPDLHPVVPAGRGQPASGRRRPARPRCEALLDSIQEELADRLVTLFAGHWPEEAAELARREAIAQIVDETADDLDTRHQAAAPPADLGPDDPSRAAPEEGHRA